MKSLLPNLGVSDTIGYATVGIDICKFLRPFRTYSSSSYFPPKLGTSKTGTSGVIVALLK